LARSPFKLGHYRRARALRRIKDRTARGRADAMAKGVKFGRKPKLTPHQRREAVKRRDKDGETLRSIVLAKELMAAILRREVEQSAGGRFEITGAGKPGHSAAPWLAFAPLPATHPPPATSPPRPRMALASAPGLLIAKCALGLVLPVKQHAPTDFAPHPPPVDHCAFV